MDRRDFLRKGSKLAAGFVVTAGLVGLVSDSAEAEQEDQELQGESNIKKGNLISIMGYGGMILGTIGVIYSLLKNRKDVRKVLEDYVKTNVF